MTGPARREASPAPCDVVIGYFVFGPERCMHVAWHTVEDADGQRQRVCGEHLSGASGRGATGMVVDAGKARVHLAQRRADDGRLEVAVFYRDELLLIGTPIELVALAEDLLAAVTAAELAEVPS